MGRRLNVSTPTVINTELVPLDESFYLDVDGQMEQWYYDNTEQYAPNRKVTPLLLVPVISAFDKDTSTSYTPAFNTTQWFANEWNESQGKYVETEITNQVDSGSADYVIQGNNLLVKKNVSYSHAVSIRCVATYIDPRDSGVTYTVEDSVNLTTNRTADVVFPEVDIISPSGRAYNPLVDDTNSQYDFKGVTTNNPVQPLNTDVRRYSIDVDGTEEILNSGEAVAPIMDIRYGENPTMADQEFMYRQTAGGTLVGESIDKAYIEKIKGNTVAWNQICSNPDFARNINGWSAEGYTYIAISYDNGRLKCTASASYKSGRATYNFSSVVGHKYYAKAIIDNVNTYDSLVRILIGDTASNTNVAQKTKAKAAGIFPATSTTGLFRIYPFYIDGVVTQGDVMYIDNVALIDLTLIYGAGNEPETVEEFEADYEKWFGKPLTYEEYDEGSLRPVLMQSVKTTGFNQWDEQWEVGAYNSFKGTKVMVSGRIRSKNHIPVFPQTSYYVTKEMQIYFYDSNKGYLLWNNIGTGTTFTTPENCYFITFNLNANTGETYNNDICINISDPSKNGTYEPYEEKVQGFDVTAIKGKLNGAGESVTIFPDGLKKAGDVQDEIFVENGVVKAIKRVGSVDLGSKDWGAYSPSYNSVFRTRKPDAKGGASIVAANAITPIYNVAGTYDVITSSQYNKYLAVGNPYDGMSILIHDESYSAGSDLKASLQGVMLYYELATPQTYVLDPITDFVWYGINDGQEVLADTLPWYVSGQGTDNLVVDAMYGENINVVLRCKMMDGETLSPSKAYATLSWRTPDIETFVQSDNGGAVRSDTEEMSFGTIVNVNGEVLSDALKRKHLAFNWKIRKNNTSTEIDKGWGQRITIDASDLRNVKGSGSTLASTLVSNEVYLKGAYEEVTDNGEVVTYNGETVYDRPID